MNTTFTFTTTKSLNKDAKMQADLGVDVYDLMTDIEKHDHAVANKKVDIQNYKGSMLRGANSIEEARDILVKMGYKDATVTVYTASTTPKETSIEDVEKSVTKGTVTKEQLQELLAKMS